MAGVSDYLEGALLNATLRGVAFPAVTGSVYVSLHIGGLDDAGGGAEPSGGAYARAVVPRAAGSWSAPITTQTVQTSNAVAITFPVATAAWGTVTAVGIWDAATGGSLLYGASLTVSKTVAVGDQPSFPAGALTLGLI